MTSPQVQTPLPLARILRTWWPLAASWMLMGAELPALSAIVARLPDPEINLAAYGGIVFPLALIIESPIIMLVLPVAVFSMEMGASQLTMRMLGSAGAILTGLH